MAVSPRRSLKVRYPIASIAFCASLDTLLPTEQIQQDEDPLMRAQGSQQPNLLAQAGCKTLTHTPGLSPRLR